MSIPNELFQSYAGEYQKKINKANQELMQIRGAMQARQRERKLSELTCQELQGLSADTDCYRTVGKMFLKEDVKVLVAELIQKVEVCAKEISAMEKMALKSDQDSKDAERNLNSLIAKVQADGLAQN